MKNSLEITNLTKHFDGVAALDGLTCAIRKGTITGVVGPNGSGKSTLVNVLTGMVRKDGGTVHVSGGVTRTFQEVRLFNQIPVLDNLLVVLTERNVFRALLERHTSAHGARAEELLRSVGLWEKRHALASTLSYGQRKLVEIARARAVDADVYLLDEPFAGLFPEMRKVVIEQIKALREAGKTVVLIEHDMGLIRELADHCIVMDAGKLLAEGVPDDVLSRPEVIEAYLGN